MLRFEFAVVLLASVFLLLNISVCEQISGKGGKKNVVVVQEAKNVSLAGKNATDVADKPKGNVTENEIGVVKIEIKRKVCPDKIGRIPFLSLPCESSKDCAILGPDLVCCKSRCIQGVDPPKPVVKHEPVLFGLVERTCPEDPLIELLDVKECNTDKDCAPTRICCPEKQAKTSTSKSYCRSASPNLDKIPLAKQLFQPFQSFASFFQCSAPPPPVLDLFPKKCITQLDCLPNLCCQEGGKKVCRPPKKSLLTLMAGVTRRFVSSDFAKKLIERIST